MCKNKIGFISKKTENKWIINELNKSKIKNKQYTMKKENIDEK